MCDCHKTPDTTITVLAEPVKPTGRLAAPARSQAEFAKAITDAHAAAAALTPEQRARQRTTNIAWHLGGLRPVSASDEAGRNK